jgi:hypothetical protein
MQPSPNSRQLSPIYTPRFWPPKLPKEDCGSQCLQEEAYNQRTTTLKKASEEGTVMTMSKAKMELAQHLDTDPLPLRKAKITQEAALKKADKANVIAQEAADRVSSARVEAQRTLSQVYTSPG